ncbi:MAG: hypothetical protein ABSC05_30075 [Candidatus Solibacter sp.]|jgi:hypothetical protein
MDISKTTEATLLRMAELLSALREERRRYMAGEEQLPGYKHYYDDVLGFGSNEYDQLLGEMVAEFLPVIEMLTKAGVLCVSLGDVTDFARSACVDEYQGAIRLQGRALENFRWVAVV